MVNSLALSTVHIPSRRFCLFAERYLLSSRVDFSFAKAIVVSRLINKSLKVRHPHKVNYSVLCIGCRDAIEIVFLKGSKCNRQKQQELDFSVIIPLQNI